MSDPDEEAVQQMEAARKNNLTSPQHKKQPSKPGSKLKRNSSGKFSKNKVLAMSAAHSKSQNNPPSPIQLQKPSPASAKNGAHRESASLKPWQGLYCSAECMAKDEQRSRLAIANLDFSPPNVASPMHPTRLDSSHSSSSHSLRSYPSEASSSLSPSLGSRRQLSHSSQSDLQQHTRKDSLTSLLPPSGALPVVASQSHRPQHRSSLLLSTSSHRQSHPRPSHIRVPSDASSSKSLPSPTMPNSPLRMSRSRGLRTYVHPDGSLDERPELHLTKSEGPRSRSNSQEASRPSPVRARTSVDRSSLQMTPAVLRPFPSMEDVKRESDAIETSSHSSHHSGDSSSASHKPFSSTRPKRHTRGLSMASTKSGAGVSIAPSTGSLAAPVLSQGEEGSAKGTIIGSPKNETLATAMETRRNSTTRPPSMSHFLRLRTYSSTSMQQLSRSPSSYEQESCLAPSPKSSASTPPSGDEEEEEYFSCKPSFGSLPKSHASNLHRHPHIQVNNPHTEGSALPHTTLQDYALFRPRSSRSPGLSTTAQDGQGWLEAQPRSAGAMFNPTLSRSRSSRSPSRAAAIFESLNQNSEAGVAAGECGTPQQRPRLTTSTSSATGKDRADNLATTRARLSGIKSSASVASLPHYHDDHWDEEQEHQQSNHFSGPATLRASSAPKNAWQWDADTPQYRVLSTNKQGAPRKRLFYFDTPDPS